MTGPPHHHRNSPARLPWNKDALVALPGHLADPSIPPILEWLESNAVEFADRPAIEAPGRSALSHADLSRHVASIAATLRSAGVGRGDVVAISVPDGPEALTALLGVASVAVAFPISVVEPINTVEHLLDRTQAKAVVFDPSRSTPMREVAERRRSLLRLRLEVAPTMDAGEFTMHLDGPPSTSPGRATAVDDAALLIQTAGTTAESKLVVWSQASIHLSAKTVTDWLVLGPHDRSLCMMPFSHLLSLIRSSLPTLVAGGCTIRCPGFDRTRVLDWLAELRPTFIAAAPEAFRSMLDRINQIGWRPDDLSLRFLATGSDLIDSETVESLVSALGIPVREFYGQSELTPMLAATAPHCSAQEGGAIGPPQDPWTVVCVDPEGTKLPIGVEGEISVKGGLLNPVIQSNESVVVDSGSEWFPTGDRGWLDERGFLHVSGRVDDRITIGGRKISPRTIEAVLTRHPDVDRSFAFPFNDSGGRTRVAALVIPSQGHELDSNVLRSLVANDVAAHFVPETIFLRSTVPVTRFGKVSRKRLADILAEESREGLDRPSPRHVPLTQTESTLCHIVCQLLDLETIDLEASFAALGGDSYFATHLLAAVRDQLGAVLSPAEFGAGGSISQLARLVDSAGNTTDARIVQVREGHLPALIFAHAPMGYTYYAHTFAEHLDEHRAVLTLQWQQPPCSIDQGLTLELYATECVKAIREHQPSGPYLLAGHSFGAHLAFEIAQQLRRAGEDIAFLALIDDSADLCKRRFGIRSTALASSSVFDQCQRMLHAYVPDRYEGNACLFVAEVEPTESLADPYLGWADLVTGTVDRYQVMGDHVSMLSKENIRRWGVLFRECLERATAAVTVPQSPSKISRDKLASTHALTADARRAAKGGERSREIRCYTEAIRQHPDQPYWVFRNLADALSESGRGDEALVAYRKSVRREAQPVDGNLRLARFLRQRDRTDEAELCVQVALERADDSLPASMLLGNYFDEIGELDRARDSFQRAVDLCSFHEEALVRLSDVLLRQGEAIEALRLVDSRLETGDRFQPNLHHRRGVLLSTLGDDHAAAEALDRAIELQPALIEARELLDTIRARSGRPSKLKPS